MKLFLYLKLKSLFYKTTDKIIVALGEKFSGAQFSSLQGPMKKKELS